MGLGEQEGLCRHDGNFEARRSTKLEGITWFFRGLWGLIKGSFALLWRPYSQTLPIALWNEQKKLQAAATDRISTARLTAGALGPTIAEIFLVTAASNPSQPPAHIELPATGFFTWISAGIVLHMLARLLLSFLKDTAK